MHLFYSPDFWKGFLLGLCIIGMSVVVVAMISRTKAKHVS